MNRILITMTLVGLAAASASGAQATGSTSATGDADPSVNCSACVASVEQVSGDVKIKRKNQKKWIDLSVDMQLARGDLLKIVTDGSSVTLRCESSDQRFRFDEVQVFGVPCRQNTDHHERRARPNGER